MLPQNDNFSRNAIMTVFPTCRIARKILSYATQPDDGGGAGRLAEERSDGQAVQA